MRDLQKALDHEMKQFQFLSVKGVMRVNKDQEKREEQAKIQEEERLKEEIEKHLKIIDGVIVSTPMPFLSCVYYPLHETNTAEYFRTQTCMHINVENMSHDSVTMYMSVLNLIE